MGKIIALLVAGIGTVIAGAVLGDKIKKLYDQVPTVDPDEFSLDLSSDDDEHYTDDTIIEKYAMELFIKSGMLTQCYSITSIDDHIESRLAEIAIKHGDDMADKIRSKYLGWFLSINIDDIIQESENMNAEVIHTEGNDLEKINEAREDPETCLDHVPEPELAEPLTTAPIEIENLEIDPGILEEEKPDTNEVTKASPAKSKK